MRETQFFPDGGRGPELCVVWPPVDMISACPHRSGRQRCTREGERHEIMMTDPVPSSSCTQDWSGSQPTVLLSACLKMRDSAKRSAVQPGRQVRPGSPPKYPTPATEGRQLSSDVLKVCGILDRHNCGRWPSRCCDPFRAHLSRECCVSAQVKALGAPGGGRWLPRSRRDGRSVGDGMKAARPRNDPRDQGRVLYVLQNDLSSGLGSSAPAHTHPTAAKAG